MLKLDQTSKTLQTKNLQEINEANQKLEELRKKALETKRKERSKKLFVKTERPHDQKAFEQRVEAYHNRKEARITVIKKQDETNLKNMFQPKLNNHTIELTKHLPKFEDKINGIIEKSKSNAPKKQKEKLAEQQSREKGTSDFSKTILKEGLNAKNSKMYEKNTEWKKEKNDKIFLKQVEQNLMTEKIPQFKPATNQNKNARMVKATFEDRSADHVKKVHKKIEKMTEELYDYSFEPKILKK